jgi:ABC-2 type transport system permease protein
MNLIKYFFNGLFAALARKEINQLLRDKSLIILLFIPPILDLLIYGFALNPDVNNIKLGIVDYAQTYQSRELISAFTENDVFSPEVYFLSERELEEEVEKGKLTAGLVISDEFSRQLTDDQTAEVQVFIDGVDANTAGITNGYISQIIQQYNEQLIDDREACIECNQNLVIETPTVFLYNPGLISSWFFIPGVMGLVYVLVSSIISTGIVIREKDRGTLEQLLMTPAESWEILLAKIVPLFILLIGNITLALLVARIIFHVPFRGNLLLFYLLSALYILIGVGIGIMLGTIARTQTQAFLSSFFINLPLIQISGAIAPVESMPNFMRYLSLFNPVTHYVVIVRGIMLRGVGLEVLWQNAIALLFFAVIILSISVNRFRRQLV